MDKYALIERPASARRPIQTRVGSPMMRLLLTAGLLLAAMAVAGCSMQLINNNQEEPAATVALEAYEAEEEATPEPEEGDADEETAEDASEENASEGEAAADEDEGDEASGGAVGTSEEEPEEPSSETERLNELLAVQSSRLAYNGEIEAVQRVDVMPEVSGMAVEVNVEVGDEVQEGDVLVRVDSASLEAQREQAMAGLSAAQAQLELLEMGPEAEDLEAARAAVDAAAAAYQELQNLPNEEDIRIADAQLRQAEAAVTVAQAAYNQVRGNPQIAALPQSLELQSATLQLEAAKAQYEKAIEGAAADQLANAYAQLVSARASLAQLERGPYAAEIRAAEAQVRQAETSLYLAQLQLEKASVTAPIDGVVSVVNATTGAMLGSGSPVVTLLSHDVKVLIAVEEFRLSQLTEGQPAIIRVDAYPDRLFEGVVTAIAPELNPTTRTVEVTIMPTSEDATVLAPGMFATVDLIAIEEE